VHVEWGGGVFQCMVCAPSAQLVLRVMGLSACSKCFGTDEVNLDLGILRMERGRRRPFFLRSRVFGGEAVAAGVAHDWRRTP
jgi:hypothetical protein